MDPRAHDGFDGFAAASRQNYLLFIMCMSELHLQNLPALLPKLLDALSEVRIVAGWHRDLGRKVRNSLRS